MASSSTQANGSDRAHDIAPTQYDPVAVPRYDQYRLYNSDTASTLETMSHLPSESRDDQDKGAGSVLSYNSTRDLSRFLQEYHGRNFNTVNEMYWLPADESEWNRLDRQSIVFSISWGSSPFPLPEVIEPILASPSGATPKRILDVGCGNGAWCLDVARRWPNIRVKGIDLAPVPLDPGSLPLNLEFEIDDINLSLTQHHSQFDLIHWRLVQGGVNDVPATVHELELCLKPGGVLLVIDADKEFRGADGKKMQIAKVDGDEDVSGVSENGSWFARMFWEAVEAGAMDRRPRERDAEFFDRGLWDHPLMDPDTAVSGSLYIPIGPWAKTSDPSETQLLKYVGVLMRQNTSNVHRAYHPILARRGVPQETIEEWSKRTQQELDTLSAPMSVRISFMMARRRSGDGLPAPPLPPDSVSNRPPHLPYPFFETFHTTEEAAAARIERRSSLGVSPTLLVRRIAKSK